MSQLYLKKRKIRIFVQKKKIIENEILLKNKYFGFEEKISLEFKLCSKISSDRYRYFAVIHPSVHLSVYWINGTQQWYFIWNVGVNVHRVNVCPCGFVKRWYAEGRTCSEYQWWLQFRANGGALVADPTKQIVMRTLKKYLRTKLKNKKLTNY